MMNNANVSLVNDSFLGIDKDLVPNYAWTVIVVKKFTTVSALVIAVVSSLLAILGFVGNVLSVLVLRLQRMGNSTNVVLISLAIADILYLISSPMRYLTTYLRILNPDMAIVVDTYLFCYGILISGMFQAGSITHILIIAFEKVIAVYFPWKVSRWLTPRRMSVMSFFAHALWYPIWLPLFFTIEVKWVLREELNQTIPVATYTDFYTNHREVFEWIHKYVVLVILGPVFSSVVLTCCLATWVKLLLASHNRLKMTSCQSSNMVNTNKMNVKVVRMLVLICTVYLTTSLPASLFMVMKSTINNISINELMYNLTTVLWAVHSSSNFVIYVFMSNKFKRSLQYFCCLKNPSLHNQR